MTEPQRKSIEYLYIRRPEELAEFCDGLKAAPTLAVDTEFIGERYYYPRLEIVQVNDGSRVGLIDFPAMEGNIEPLAGVLGNPKTLKVFHAADQDLAILERELGTRTLPMFDTQVAASLLGYGTQVSLANLTRALLHVRMSSKQSTSDWSHRPLSEEQLDYAADDVLYLIELWEKLEARLAETGRAAWYRDEQDERLESIFANQNGSDENLYRKVKDWMSLNAQELAVLRELTAWRERTARERNVPRRGVLTDEGLVELARFQPESAEKARKLRRVNVGQVLKSFKEIRTCIDKARKLPREQWPQKPTPERPDIPTGLMEVCQALLRTQAETNEVAPSLLATSADLQRIIVRRENLDERAEPLLHGWRREVAGEYVLRLLRGQLSVRVNRDGSLAFDEHAPGD